MCKQREQTITDFGEILQMMILMISLIFLAQALDVPHYKQKAIFLELLVGVEEQLQIMHQQALRLTRSYKCIN